MVRLFCEVGLQTALIVLGFGLRRVPMETHYYEAYNQDNVRLVDLLTTPIECITDHTVKTTEEEIKCDVLVYATGFSASKQPPGEDHDDHLLTNRTVTGSFEAIDFRGIDDVRLIDKWSNGPQTFLGMTIEHFPNMFMSIGPHQAYGNIPRSIEYAVGWIAECIEYMETHGKTYIEPTGEAVRVESYVTPDLFELTFS